MQNILTLSQKKYPQLNPQLHKYLYYKMPIYRYYIALIKSAIEPLPKNSNAVFKELLIFGEIPRGKVASLIGASDRTGTSVVKELLRREYIESDSLKGPIKLKIDAYFASHLFPELIPEPR